MKKAIDKLKSWWSGAPDGDARIRFLEAGSEVRRCKVVRRGPRRTRQREDGFFSVSVYFSPEEYDVICRIADEEGLSTSKAIRAILRTFTTIPVDAPPKKGTKE